MLKSLISINLLFKKLMKHKPKLI